MRGLLVRWRMEKLEAQFITLSAVLLALVGILLFALAARTMAKQALDTAAEMAGLDNAVLAPLFLELPQDVPLTAAHLARVDQAVAAQGEQRYASVKVWSPQGRILYSTQRDQIGQQFWLESLFRLRTALSGGVAAKLSSLDEPEHQAEAALGFRRLLEVYTPLRDPAGHVVGAFEIYRDAGPLLRQIRGLQRLLAIGLALGLLVVWAGLYGLIRRAGDALRREHRSLVQAQRDREATLLGALAALSESVEAKDAYTAGHVDRVAAYARTLARALGLDAEAQREVEFAAVLHDVGKVSIPDSILQKPGSLTPAERSTMETHAARGEHILARVPGLAAVARLVRHHHEHWNGYGYPDGLRGKEAPLGARIIAVADAFDAMTTDRPYRPAMDVTGALEELRRGKGSQFDPDLVELIIRLEVASTWPGAA